MYSHLHHSTQTVGIRTLGTVPIHFTRTTVAMSEQAYSTPSDVERIDIEIQCTRKSYQHLTKTRHNLDASLYSPVRPVIRARPTNIPSFRGETLRYVFPSLGLGLSITVFLPA